MAIRSEPNSLNSITEFCCFLRPRQAKFLSFIKPVRTLDAADSPGIGQERFIEMANKADIGLEPSISGTQFSAVRGEKHYIVWVVDG